MASRIAAKSTIAGTPVKSCISTRLGVNAISMTPAPQGPSPRAPRRRARERSCRPRCAAGSRAGPQRERQAGDVEALLQRLQPEDLERAPAHLQRATGAERVGMPALHRLTSPPASPVPPRPAHDVLRFGCIDTLALTMSLPRRTPSSMSTSICRRRRRRSPAAHAASRTTCAADRSSRRWPWACALLARPSATAHYAFGATGS